MKEIQLIEKKKSTVREQRESYEAKEKRRKGRLAKHLSKVEDEVKEGKQRKLICT